MLIDDLPTPVLLIEEHRLENNLARMAARASENGVSLRPHVKTHKSVSLARRQMAHGAAGITVAKPGEAEAFVQAGIDDVRIAYPLVSTHRLEAVAAMMRSARVSFCVDSTEAAYAASQFFASNDLKAGVLMEVDTGYGRSGFRDNESASIRAAAEIARLPGLRLEGLLTHAGHSYHGPRKGETLAEALGRVSNEERDRMIAFACTLREAGVKGATPGNLELSIGSTPSMAAFNNVEKNGFTITEIRPGNYLFHDAMQVALGVAGIADCALTVLATVVSRHRDRSGKERLFIDAGKKVLTTDVGYGTPGHGLILFNSATMETLPHVQITGLSEEHGWVQVSGGSTLKIGDRVRVVPNHACVTMHTQDQAYIVDGDRVVEKIAIDARGRSD
jgi:D-serine deaminase-like pyridoxal phosphate-dependent protein